MSTFDAENADNLEDIEKQFAVKSVKQLEAYWNLLSSIPGSKLKLTKHDDDIYNTFIEDFPEYSTAESVKFIKEEDLKSVEGKKRWRAYCEKFNTIEDFNFGTMLRLKSDEEYTQHNTIFAVRIQFYAFEIARNRHGLNDWVSEQK